jgi:methionyl-tRNA formyltransferase
MGTPDFAVPCLEALVKSGEEILGVITQPDRPKGRGKQLTPSPVKVKATEYGIPVYQPECIRTPEFVSLLKGIQPELIVVVAFGQLLSPEILNLPPYGCVNVHASLLPHYRGAAPIHRAVLNGEKTTGVTTMFMDQGLDTGDMILGQPITITPEDTVGTIHDKLAEVGAQLLLKTIEGIKLGQAPRTPQDNSKATYAEMLRREHELIDWGRGAEQLWNQIRGMNPWPGAYTLWEEKVLKVWKAEVWTAGVCAPEVCAPEVCAPGREASEVNVGGVLKVIPGKGLVVQTGQGQLLLQEIQLQGSRRLRVEEFIRGHNISVGTRLGKGE